MKVALLMGSDSDYPRLEPCVQRLREFEIECEVRVLSAHRTPDQVVEFVRGAPARGVRLFLCAAGGAAHLAGVVSGHTDLPEAIVRKVSERYLEICEKITGRALAHGGRARGSEVKA